jgi:NitT/TauT family transport system substrate-binding protein/putative hydroxymethylpyrimidine transport system substrate-binding protein
MGRVAALLAAVLTLAGGIVSCGGEDGAEPGAPEGAILVLDFQPNAVHAPLYASVATGGMDDAGIDLEIREPSGTGDGAKLLQSGRADFAILDINDFGIAREQGVDIVAVGAIVQRPLASVIAAGPEAPEAPAGLEGQTVGVTGVPSDEAVLDTVLAAAGLEPDSVERMTIGFTAVPALAAGRIAAATAFWNAEGVQLRQQGVPVQEFRVDEYGAPRYPELVIATAGDGDAPADRGLTCRLLRGLGPSYGSLDNDPQAAIDAMVEEVPGLDATSQEGQYAELIAADAFAPGDAEPSSPALDKGAVADWADWASEHGVVSPRAGEELPSGFLPNAVRNCTLDPPEAS